MSIFDDGDFFIDDDELAEDNQMSVVDDAIMKSLDAMEKVIADMKNNLKFNEQQDARHNLRILTMHLDSAIRLSEIDEKGLSDEEVFEEIEKVIKQTTQLTFSNMNDLLPQEEPDENTQTFNADTTNGSTDFDF